MPCDWGLVPHRAAVRENDGANYIINLGGRIDQELVSLIPSYDNVMVSFIEGETLHSDTCTFQRSLADLGRLSSPSLPPL